MKHLISRRALVCGGVAAALTRRPRFSAAQAALPAFSLPIGWSGQVLGDGFYIRHGYACENLWYNPGWLHTAEDYYAIEGNTAGAGIYAIADGEIVFAGSDYPGLVVIVRHADDLYSMYGHLDPGLAVSGGPVFRGQLLGSVLDRGDGRAPSHLHFEVRTFLTTPQVNGATPLYVYACGYECPPGPGYWPMGVPEHPSEMGWRNPTHVIARRSFLDGVPFGAEVTVAQGADPVARFWTSSPDDEATEPAGELSLVAGARYRLLDISRGREATRATSAESYRLWYQVQSSSDGAVWIQAAVPSDEETGSDWRPSALRFAFLPVAWGAG
jgi:hypothetical protein